MGGELAGGWRALTSSAGSRIVLGFNAQSDPLRASRTPLY